MAWTENSITLSFPSLSAWDLSNDTKTLIILLSHLRSDSPINISTLKRGASSHYCWTENGDKEISPPPEELSSDLVDLLRDETRVNHSTSALVEAQLLEIVPEDDEYRITLDAVAKVKNNLPNSVLEFWKPQVMLIMYRAVSWKYLDWSDSLTIIPHLQHVLQEMESFPELCPTTKSDLTLSLVEAARYPGLAWKSKALDWANKVQLANTQDNDSGWFANGRILLASSVLLRLQGRVEDAKEAVESATRSVECRVDSRAMTVTERCLLGQASIQEALNAIQMDRLDIAEQCLNKSRAANQTLSLMEQTILFRQLALMGRIQRFRGNFDSSLHYLEQADSVLRNSTSCFIEEIQDFTSDHADTLRELDRSEEGQVLIENVLHRLSRRPGLKHQLLYAKLKMSLAECYFSLGKFQKAREVCDSIKNSGQRLLKMEHLRLQVTLAKLCDTSGCREDASTHWNTALDVLARYPKVQGYTTRAIQLANGLPVDETHPIDDAVDATKYWIAGLSKWNAKIKKT